MKNSKNILEITKNTILLKANAIKNSTNLLGGDIIKAIQTIVKSKGRIIVTEIGKSANTREIIVLIPLIKN